MKKMICLAAAMVFGIAGVFAEEKSGGNDSSMYAKLSLGYTHGGAEVEFDVASTKIKETLFYSGFEIAPAFGYVLPIFEDKPFDIAAEASVGIAFGSDVAFDSSTTVINPGLMGIFNWHFENSESSFLQKFVPYAGLGFSVPIQMVSWDYTIRTYPNGTLETKKESFDSTVVGFRINMLMGARYEFTDSLSALAEFGAGVLGTFSYSFRVGAMYKF